jgi:hypothetical protein
MNVSSIAVLVTKSDSYAVAEFPGLQVEHVITFMAFLSSFRLPFHSSTQQKDRLAAAFTADC